MSRLCSVLRQVLLSLGVAGGPGAADADAAARLGGSLDSMRASSGDDGGSGAPHALLERLIDAVTSELTKRAREASEAGRRLSELEARLAARGEDVARLQATLRCGQLTALPRPVEWSPLTCHFLVLGWPPRPAAAAASPSRP